MLFNSFTFGFFLFVVYFLYWALFNRTKQWRNLFLLAASYFFYGSWDWRFLGLIFAISVVDFVSGAAIYKTEKQGVRKVILVAALIINLGVLGFFKYYNFFTDSLIQVLEVVHVHTSLHTMNIILPVGISFFTFQGLSYVLDIYYKKFEPTKDVVAFMTFISFFPQLVAGPIERAKDLLPQFTADVRRKAFDYDEARLGFIQIAIGLFKKMVIADRIAVYVDHVHANVGAVGGGAVALALVFFALQLYLDFSAYSQIAIGTARVLGYKLSTNFNSPYTATSFKDFWARWHITLTGWFRDYLYFPLGGSRKGKLRTYVNVMIIFVVSGLWHGALWTFVVWGALNGLALVAFDKMFRLNPTHLWGKLFSCAFVVGYWTLSLAFFRAASCAQAILLLKNLFVPTTNILALGLCARELIFSALCIVGLLGVEFLQRYKQTKADVAMLHFSLPLRWALYLLLVFGTIFFGVYGMGNDVAFIYFQF